VVERGRLPGGGGVATAAVCAVSALVGIVTGVAGDAIGGRAFIFVRCGVAFGAGDADMRTSELEGGIIMVESRGLPGG